MLQKELKQSPELCFHAAAHTQRWESLQACGYCSSEGSVVSETSDN